MKDIKLYGITTCDTCRKARKFLDTLGVSYTFVDLRKEASDEHGHLNRSLASRIFSEVSWESLLNKRSTTWRQLSDADKNELDGDKAHQLLIEHPTLLKRPILDDGNTFIVGFDQEAYEKLA